MSLAVASRPAPVPTRLRARPARAILALSRAEGWRLVRHPMVLVGAAIGVALFVALTWQRAPVLNRDDVATGITSLPIALGTFLAANLAALRGRRHGTEELYDSQVMTPGDRTVGLLLGVVWPAALALGLVVLELAYLFVLRPVASPSVLELVTGPAVVVLGGAAGVAVASWIPSVAAGPVGMVALAALQIFLLVRLPDGTNHQAVNRWLAPWVPLAASGEPPRELVVRPAAWHLAYLIGLTLVAAGLALLRRGSRGRPAAVVACGVALAVIAGGVQARPPSAGEGRAIADLITHPAAHQVCRTEATVRYCAYPSYAPWIDRWSVPIDRVLAAVPPADRPEMLVRQGMNDAWASQASGLPQNTFLLLRGQPPAIRPGTRWGRGSEAAPSELGLSIEAAAWAVGLPRTIDEVVATLSPRDIRRLVEGFGPASPQDRAQAVAGIRSDPFTYVGGCSPEGQARAVVAVWLAAQGSPGNEALVRRVIHDDPYGFHRWTATATPGGAATTGFDFQGPSQWELPGDGFADDSYSPVIWPKAEVNLAAQLLSRPDREVGATIRANWDRLTDPATPTSDLVALFHLTPLPTLEQQGRALGMSNAEIADSLGGSYDVPCR